MKEVHTCIQGYAIWWRQANQAGGHKSTHPTNERSKTLTNESAMAFVQIATGYANILDLFASNVQPCYTRKISTMTPFASKHPWVRPSSTPTTIIICGSPLNDCIHGRNWTGKLALLFIHGMYIAIAHISSSSNDTTLSTVYNVTFTWKSLTKLIYVHMSNRSNEPG